jgi:hypothetical protein
MDKGKMQDVEQKPSRCLARDSDEFPLPWEPFQGVSTIVFHAVALLGVFGAVYRLAQWPDTSPVRILASLLWIALYVGMEVGRFRSDGSENSLINRLHYFARDNFIKVVRRTDGPTTFVFGYRLRGHVYTLTEFRADGIQKVYWSTGQCSSHAFRDTNDWGVVIWLKSNSVLFTTDKKRHPDASEVRCFRSKGSKADAEEIGQQFLRFLSENGVAFVAGDKPPGAAYGYSDSSAEYCVAPSKT